MIRIDTIHLEVPVDAVRGVKKEGFEPRLMRYDIDTGTGVLHLDAKRESRPVGCVSVKYKEGEHYQVKMSAKTLGQNYLEGININTFEQALSGISSLIDIDAQRLLDSNPKVMSFDVTDNIQMSDIGGTKKELIHSLVTAKMNERFIPVMYESKNKLGAEFRGTQQERNRLIVYCKYLDLHKRENKEFIKQLPNPMKLFTQAENTIRVENNIGNLESARNRLKINDNNLMSILTSDEKVNHKMMNKILKLNTNQLSIFSELDNSPYKGDDWVMKTGIDTIVRRCNFNMKIVRDVMKKAYGDNFKYRYYRASNPLSRLIQEVKVSTSSDSVKVLTITDRLLDALSKTG